MVRSWFPTFLLPFSLEKLLVNSSKSQLWMGDVEEGAISLFIVLEEILPIVLRSCPTPSTAFGGKNFGCSLFDSCFFHFLFLSQFSFQKPARLSFAWQDRGFCFLRLFFFLSKSFSIACTDDHWMVRPWFPTFLFPFSLEKFVINSSKSELWMGRCGGRAMCTTKYTLNSKHLFRIFYL